MNDDAESTISRVFISYASQDVLVADKLCRALEAAGLPCWIAPRDVRAGEYAQIMPENIGSAYGCRRQLDQAFAWLERAYRQHDGGLPGIKSDPCMRNLAPDARYKLLLHKLNLAD